MKMGKSPKNRIITENFMQCEAVENGGEKSGKVRVVHRRKNVKADFHAHPPFIHRISTKLCTKSGYLVTLRSVFVRCR